MRTKTLYSINMKRCLEGCLACVMERLGQRMAMCIKAIKRGTPATKEEYEEYEDTCDTSNSNIIY